MRSFFVIFFLPGIEDDLRFFNRPEPIGTQAFVPECSIETFNETVFGRFSRPDEIQFNTMQITPLIYRLANKFRPIVTPYPSRFAVIDNGLVQKPGNLNSSNRLPCLLLQRHAVECVDEIEYPEPGAVMQSI